MDLTTTFAIIAIVYGILLFFDIFFKSCAHYPYIRFLNGTGVTIKFLQIKWQTTACNRFFLRWGNSLRFLNAWFTCGLYTTLILLPISVIILLIAISQNIFYSRHNQSPTNLVVEPLIPGVNLPGSEIGYYSLSLILSSIVHEIGHALASVQEDVHIINVGMNVFFILPVAYVNLSSERLSALNPWRALKILCAGIWHNLVLSLIACVIYISLPFCYSAFFQINAGVLVRSLTENSPLVGDRGLNIGDVITRINSCEVTNEDTFYECLHRAYVDKAGFCVDADVVHNLDESVPLRDTSNGFDCCEATKTDSICFEYIEKNDGMLEIPPHACLPARVVIESSKFSCGNRIDCPMKLHCIKALLDNSTCLLQIARVDKPHVIYIGHPGDILQTVVTSPYIPKYFYSFILIPEVVMKFLEYVIVLSTGLVLVNVIPCLFMDGQHITGAVVQIVMKGYTRENTRMISTFISLLSTIILLAHCIYSVWLKFV